VHTALGSNGLQIVDDLHVTCTDRVVESNNVSTLMVVTIVIEITTNISSSAALMEMVISITISIKSWPIPCLTVKDRVNAIVYMYLVIFVCL